jgi:hypothetical protein
MVPNALMVLIVAVITLADLNASDAIQVVQGNRLECCLGHRSSNYLEIASNRNPSDQPECEIPILIVSTPSLGLVNFVLDHLLRNNTFCTMLKKN